MVKDLKRNLNCAESDLKKTKAALGQARMDFKNLTKEQKEAKELREERLAKAEQEVGTVHSGHSAQCTVESGQWTTPGEM